MLKGFGGLQRRCRKHQKTAGAVVDRNYIIMGLYFNLVICLKYVFIWDCVDDRNCWGKTLGKWRAGYARMGAWPGRQACMNANSVEIKPANGWGNARSVGHGTL